MFGIAGFATNRPETWASATIERMVERLVHRGPDDKGVLVIDSVALRMRRLSIIDVGHGKQPITTNNRTLLTCGMIEQRNEWSIKQKELNSMKEIMIKKNCSATSRASCRVLNPKTEQKIILKAFLTHSFV